MYYLSAGCGKCCCKEKSDDKKSAKCGKCCRIFCGILCGRLDMNYFGKKKQCCLLILILVGTLSLILAAILISALDDEVYNRLESTKNSVTGDGSGEDSSLVPEIITVWDKMYCNDKSDSDETSDSATTTTGDGNPTVSPVIAPSTSPITFWSDSYTPTISPIISRRRMQVVPNIPAPAGPDFCADGRESIIIAALFFVLLSWYFYGIASYLWDKYHNQFKPPVEIQVKPKPNKRNLERKFKRYSVIYIGVKTQKKKSWFGSKGGESYSVMQIELYPTDCTKLHMYLNTVVPFYHIHKFKDVSI